MIMKRNYLKFIVVLFLFVIIQACSKSKQCECNTPFVYNKYYNPGDIVSNRDSCWMLYPKGTGGYIDSVEEEPRGTFPATQDYWIKICEK